MKESLVLTIKSQEVSLSPNIQEKEKWCSMKGRRSCLMSVVDNPFLFLPSLKVLPPSEKTGVTSLREKTLTQYCSAPSRGTVFDPFVTFHTR